MANTLTRVAVTFIEVDRRFSESPLAEDRNRLDGACGTHPFRLADRIAAP